MKQGTIQIDCSDKYCWRCNFQNWKLSFCICFGKEIKLMKRFYEHKRCQQCLETFKESKDEK